VSSLVLTRYGSTPYGTFGQIKVGKETFYTCERPWLENKPHVSCIPLGCYSLLLLPTTTLVPSSYGEETWYFDGETVAAIPDTRQRSRCAIHIGNISSDVSGCVLLGTSLGWVKGCWGVLSSRAALERFSQAVGRVNHHILIQSSPCG